VSTPAIHLSFVGADQVIVTVGARTYTVDELKKLGLVTVMHTMFLDRMREQLLSLVTKLPIGETS
jgi:hypothetical protein